MFRRRFWAALDWVIYLVTWTGIGPREPIFLLGLVLFYYGICGLVSAAAARTAVGIILIWLAIPPAATPPVSRRDS